MSLSNSFFPWFRKNKASPDSSFGMEISIALLVKFILLGGLWWALFAGTKQPVDEGIIAGKLFGEHRPLIHSPKSQEKP